MYPRPTDYGPLDPEYAHSSVRLSIPGDSKPRRYLSFAVEDLASGLDARNTVNALSNAKRALHFQVEIIADAFGFDCSKHRPFPPRLEFCQKCGIVGPRILSKINRVRNAVEHEYIIPTRSETEDFVDVVELFLAATDRFLFQFPIDLEFLAEPNSDSAPAVSWIKFEPGSSEVVLQGDLSSRGQTPPGWTDDGTWKVLAIPATDPAFFKWISLLVQAPMDA